MEHINILGLVLFLLAGAWSAAAVLREKSVFGGAFLDAMWRNLVCYIAYNLYYACLLYALENVAPLQAFLSSRAFRVIHGLTGNGLLVAMTYYFATMIFRLGGRSLPAVLAKLIPLSFLAVAALTAVRAFIDPQGNDCTPAKLALRFFMIPLHAVCMGCLLWLIRRNGRQAAGKGRNAVAIFAAFQVVFFLFYVDTAFSYLPFLRPWPLLASILYNRGTEILYALTPWIWLKFIYIPLKQNLWSGIQSTVDFDSFRRHHELTKREVEVLGLLVEGRSYRQIGEALFISVNTVKNHAYSLFRKLEVASRHELIGKVGDYRRVNPVASDPM